MSERVAEGIRLFNRRRFFEAHEVWELEWQEAEGKDRELVAALIQVAAAMHLRFEREGRKGPKNLLSSALAALEDLGPVRLGVDVRHLLAEVTTFLERLEDRKDRAPGLVDRMLVPKIRQGSP